MRMIGGLQNHTSTTPTTPLSLDFDPDQTWSRQNRKGDADADERQGCYVFIISSESLLDEHRERIKTHRNQKAEQKQYLRKKAGKDIQMLSH